MRFLILFLLATTQAFAVEITTIELQKSGELQFVTTDETLEGLVEKSFIGKTCQPRQSVSQNLREFYFPRSCKAHIIQFLMNNGLKADPSGSFFSK